MKRQIHTHLAMLVITIGVGFFTSRPTFGQVSSRQNQEVVPPGEAEAIDAIVNTITQIVSATYSAGARPVTRDAHAKGHGCVKAEVKVFANLPSELRQGVFAGPRSFPAWIRFSNGNGTPQDDHSGDGRGMAIKLMGVVGQKLLADEAKAQTQDFVMINHPVFFVRNAADYVTFTALSKNNRANEFFQTHPHEAQISGAITAKNIGHVFEQRYFSMTPYLLGQHPIKFSATPIACATGAPLNPSGGATSAADPNYLRAGMRAWLNEKDACFNLAVQPQTDPAAMPIEDPTIAWDEAKAPFITVAVIRIPQQQFDSAAQQRFCENLSFTPWHALHAHRPVGGINRVRKVVYETISKLRHKLNAAPRVEPTGQETFK